MTISIDAISKNFINESVLYTHHAKTEMEIEEFGRIIDEEVFEAVKNGEVIESYPDDKPYPSVLVFGLTGKGRPLHMVVVYNVDEDITIVITVYQPKPEKWIEYRRRVKQ